MQLPQCRRLNFISLFNTIKNYYYIMYNAQRKKSDTPFFNYYLNNDFIFLIVYIIF